MYVKNNSTVKLFPPQIQYEQGRAGRGVPVCLRHPSSICLLGRGKNLCCYRGSSFTNITAAPLKKTGIPPNSSRGNYFLWFVPPSQEYQRFYRTDFMLATDWYRVVFEHAVLARKARAEGSTGRHAEDFSYEEERTRWCRNLRGTQAQPFQKLQHEVCL